LGVATAAGVEVLPKPPGEVKHGDWNAVIGMFMEKPGTEIARYPFYKIPFSPSQFVTLGFPKKKEPGGAFTDLILKRGSSDFIFQQNRRDESGLPHSLFLFM
jgi:hypothetical protein